MTMFETDIEPSEELLTSKTILLAKNSETGNPMNYRPIALLNTMYKIYTAILKDGSLRAKRNHHNRTSGW